VVDGGASEDRVEFLGGDLGSPEIHSGGGVVDDLNGCASHGLKVEGQRAEVKWQRSESEGS